MKKDYIFNNINSLKGIGPQLTKYLKKRKIEKIKDIILNLPYSETDRSKILKLNNLEIGSICSIKVKVKKLNFPRIRNLPNKIVCEDETGKIDIVYFNSREGYLKKLYPISNIEQSDTAIFDNCLELLVASGYPLAHAIMMMIPEPWEQNEQMEESRRAFYEYHASMMEPNRGSVHKNCKSVFRTSRKLE